MDTQTTLYIVFGGIALMVAGWAAFPFSLSYANTSWMPGWMRPGVDYLERAHDFDYPADMARVQFSILLALTGLTYIMGLMGFHTNPPVPFCDGVVKWLTLQLPSFMFMNTFALRSLGSPGVARYNDDVTRPKWWKLLTVYLLPFVLIGAYSQGMPLTVFRACSVAYTALAAVFLVYDFCIVYRARWSDEFLKSRFNFGQMCPESYFLVYFIIGSAVLLPYLWTGDFRLPLAFGVLTLVFVLFEHVLRFHWVENYDYFMRNFDYGKDCRRAMWLRNAEQLCRLAGQGKGIFRDDGREWTVIVTQHPEYSGYLFVCTSDYADESFRLDLVGEQEVFTRDFATLREAFEYRLHLVRLYQNARRKASSRTETLFENALLREDDLEKKNAAKKKKACMV